MKPVHFTGAVVMLFTVLLFSCSKSDEYKKFLESGPQVFPAKVDSLKIATGRYRVMVSWIISSDPSVVKARIYWNNRADSLDVPIVRTNGADTIKAIVDGLEEKPYTFEVFTFNKQGDRSVGVSASGRALGERYEEALLNWGIVHKQIIGAAPPYNAALVLWDPFYLDGLVGVLVGYTNADGEKQETFIAADPVTAPAVISSVFDKFVPGALLTYNTLYLPEKQALDTLKATTQEITVP